MFWVCSNDPCESWGLETTFLRSFHYINGTLAGFFCFFFPEQLVKVRWITASTYWFSSSSSFDMNSPVIWNWLLGNTGSWSLLKDGRVKLLNSALLSYICFLSRRPPHLRMLYASQKHFSPFFLFECFVSSFMSLNFFDIFL